MVDIASAENRWKYNYTEDLLNLEKKRPEVARRLPITVQNYDTNTTKHRKLGEGS